jgi:hypothetical protein
MLTVCETLSADPASRPDFFVCPITAFQKWRLGSGLSFPVEEAAFSTAFLSFLQHDVEGRKLQAHVGFDSTGSMVRWVRVDVRTYVDQDTEGTTLQPIYDHFAELAAALSRAPFLGPALMFAPSFARMQVELAFISGTLRSIAISGALVALAIMVFTRNLVLMLLTTAVIVSTVVCLAGLFVVWGWPFGAVEAISISLVCGMAVLLRLSFLQNYSPSRLFLFSL